MVVGHACVHVAHQHARPVVALGPRLRRAHLGQVPGQGLLGTVLCRAGRGVGAALAVVEPDTAHRGIGGQGLHARGGQVGRIGARQPQLADVGQLALGGQLGEGRRQFVAGAGQGGSQGGGGGLAALIAGDAAQGRVEGADVEAQDRLDDHGQGAVGRGRGEGRAQARIDDLQVVDAAGRRCRGQAVQAGA